jgi:phosphatidylglycerol:prolipoprotein diacylglycerol transferase
MGEGNVKPIFYAFGQFELSSYALMLSIGSLLAFWLTYRESIRKGYPAEWMLTFTLTLFVVGMIGARGVSWLIHYKLYATLPFWKIFLFWDKGGTSSFGGIALAGGVGLLWLRLRHLRPWDVSDLLVFAWVPFLAVTRIGCFLNGCCHGLPTMSPLGLVAGGPPSAVNFRIPSHPTQLYALFALTAIFCLLGWMRTRRRFEGQLTVVFCVLYGSFRFGLELLRGDAPLAWRFGELGIYTVNQLIAVPLVLFGLAAGLYLALGARGNDAAAAADPIEDIPAQGG